MSMKNKRVAVTPIQIFDEMNQNNYVTLIFNCRILTGK